MSLRAYGQRLSASMRKLTANFMKGRPSQPRLSIFELQPLEQRLFLTASPTVTLNTSAPLEGTTLTFALSSNDNDGEGIDHWVIDPGDGTGAQTLTGDHSSFTHTYADGGHYTISASVTENTTTDTGGTGGDTGGDTGGTGGGGGGTGGGGTYNADPLYITVGPGPIVAVPGRTTYEGTSYNTTVSTLSDPSDTDVDSIATIVINWGDGNSNTYHASDFVGGTMPNPLIVNHTYTESGSYTVTTTATDQDGVTGTITSTATINPVAPIVALTGNNSVVAGVLYSASVATSAASNDPDTDPIQTIVMNWGDGNTTTYHASDYSNGIIPNPLSVSHTYTAVGSYTLTATATDDDGASAGAALNGQLDVSFGTNGIATTDFSSQDDEGHSIALQTDPGGSGAQKIIAAGRTYVSSAWELALARYNTNGSLDTTFGSSGKVLLQFGGVDAGQAIALQDDSSILVGGLSSSGGLAVARFTPNGVLDTTFGTSGIASANFTHSGTGTTGIAIETLADGTQRIIAVGTVDANVVIAAFTMSGSLDTTFGTTGKFSTDLGGSDQAYAVATDSSGEITVSGISSGQFALVRYNTDGTLDGGFGNSGISIIPTANGYISGAAMAVQADGKYVVAGTLYTSAQPSQFILDRVNSDGSQDSSFNSGNELVTGFGVNAAYGNAVALSNDVDGLTQDITVAGQAGSQVALARYKTDGTPDPTFGANGIITNSVGASASAAAAAYLPGNVLALVGTTQSNLQSSSTIDFLVARYMPDNTLTVIAPLDSLGATAVSTGEIDLTWAVNTASITGIQVDRSTDGTNFTAIATNLSATTTSYADTSSTLTENTHYWYRVHASSSSVYSNTSDAYTLPRTPSNLTATANGTNEVDLWWINNSSGSPAFVIQRSTDNGSTYSTIAQTSPGATSYSDYTAADATASAYRVSALSAEGISTPTSNSATATTGTLAPFNLTTSVASTSEIDLSFNNPGLNSTSLEVDRSTDGTTFSVLTSSLSGTANSYQDTSIPSVGQYWYKVRANGPAGASAFTNLATGCTIVTGLTATATSTTSVSLSWVLHVSNATSIEVDRSSDGSSYSALTTTLAGNATSYTDSSASEGTQYWYQIDTGFSNAPAAASTSSTASSTWTTPAAPSSLSASADGAAGVDLTWTNNSSNASFEVESAPSGSSTYSLLGLTALTTYLDTSTTELSAYNYRVTAVGGGGLNSLSSHSNSVTATAPLNAPSNLRSYDQKLWMKTRQ